MGDLATEYVPEFIKSDDISVQLFDPFLTKNPGPPVSPELAPYPCVGII